MNRNEYRDLMRRVRTAAKDGAKRQWHFVAAERFENNGSPYTVLVKRLSSGGRAAYEVKTSLLSERPRRQLAADALQWAAWYRNVARTMRHVRAQNIRAARLCISEAADYRSAFNRLPGYGESAQ
jgi:hypothetical protein